MQFSGGLCALEGRSSSALKQGPAANIDNDTIMIVGVGTRRGTNAAVSSFPVLHIGDVKNRNTKDGYYAPEFELSGYLGRSDIQTVRMFESSEYPNRPSTRMVGKIRIALTVRIIRIFHSKSRMVLAPCSGPEL